MENTWVHSSPYAPLPPFAVIGGHDCDGSPMYVGRSFHEGDNLPAKVIPSKGSAYIAWGGTEHCKSHYEVLVGQGYAWIPCYGGSVPPNAVRTGSTRTGEPLYVGRGHHANSLTVGKIHPSHGCLYIPFGGQEVRINTYEVLVHEQRENWVASTPNYTPPQAVVAGHDTDRATIYVGRAMHEDYKWVHSSAYSTIPPYAVIGGNDSDGTMMYVGRSFHNGDMLPAKVMPSKHIAFISWRGEECPKEHFEVLCGHNLAWRHCYDHVIPENAILCGTTKLHQPVYIGRGHYEGSLTVGKVSSVHRALFIPFGGAERRLETYEILVDEKRPATGWSIPSPSPPPPLAEKPYPPMDIKPPMYTPMPPSESPYPYPPMDSKPPVYTPMPQPFSEKPFSYLPMDTKPPMYTPMPQPTPLAPPPPAITPATPYEPPPPYVPQPPMQVPAPSRPHDLWMTANSSYTPSNAVHGGHDTDLSTIYVSRAFHEGELIPGKALPSRACAFVSFNGQEIPKSNFEVLVGDRYHWVSAHDGNVAPGAVEAGRTASGEPLFVGRAQYCGSLTPGKIQRSHQCLYIAFGGRERRITNYEVLVRTDEFYRGQSLQMNY